jgi:type IV pilus assembly protein PilQ
MTPKETLIAKQILLIILTASIAVLFNGCNADNLPTTNSLPSKRITEILVSENDKSWDCIIKGKNTLTFSAINQISPAGVLLYFPETILDIPAPDPIVPENEIIGSVEASEFVDGYLKNSRILIGLKMDRPYSISPDENGLKFSFPKTLARAVDDAPVKISAESIATPANAPDFSPASRLTTVTATSLINHTIVNLAADGTITNYKSFAIENPPRIVFDVYSIQSPHTEGQTIPVHSKWVNQMRYHPYPDKIRLVLDTEEQALTNYFSFPTANGLLIYVGRMPEPLRKN